ncbi:hypothetical protein SCALM49S_08213 [Streptomyces californicus]
MRARAEGAGEGAGLWGEGPGAGPDDGGAGAPAPLLGRPLPPPDGDFSPRSVSRSSRSVNSGSSGDCSAASAIALVSWSRSSMETSSRTDPLSWARRSSPAPASRSGWWHWVSGDVASREADIRAWASPRYSPAWVTIAPSHSTSARHGASAAASSRERVSREHRASWKTAFIRASRFGKCR